MRLQILTFLCSLFVFVLASGNLKDKADIKDVLNVFALEFDEQNYDQFGNVLSNDVIFDVGEGRPFQGLQDTISGISKIKPNDTVSDTIVSNVLIKFLPPLDKEGRSDRAEALSSNSFFFFRGANSTSSLYAVFARFEDKEIIRTGEPGLGGWRIKNRKLKLIVSFPLPQKLVTHITECPCVAFKSVDVDLRNL